MAMRILSNPTSKLSKSQLWGFEITHLLIALGVMLTSNSLLSMTGLPVIFSWLVAAIALVALKASSAGKRPGHLGFVIARVCTPRIFLGCKLAKKKVVLS